MIKSTISQRLDELHEQAAAKHAVWKRARRRLIVELAVWIAAILFGIAHASARIEQGGPWWWTFTSAVCVFVITIRAQYVAGQIGKANECLAVCGMLEAAIETARDVFGSPNSEAADDDADDSYPVPRHEH